MQRVLAGRVAMFAMAAIVAMAASIASTAQYAAEKPGGELKPIGGAAESVSIIQGSQTVFWYSLTGPVTLVTTRGWPVSDGEVELGGGIAIAQPDSGAAGMINTGERPMSVSFDFDG